jgi:hypothetical protein
MNIENSPLKARLAFASIRNKHLQLDYLTTTGPRIIGLYANGVDENLLAETPDVHWETPHGEYHLRGGHRLWTAPEDPFYTSPEDGIEVTEEDGRVILKSPVDASGLQKEISIGLDQNCVSLSHCVTWHGEQPIRLAPWTITQLRLGGMAVLPFTNAEGLLPNRNLVFWPYASVKDERFELHDDVVLVHGHGMNKAFKIGNFNSQGWVACTLGNVLFIKRFAADSEGNYPDMGCNVEAYVKDSCIELETLGTLKTLNHGDSLTHEEIWEIFPGQYPATLESARKIKKQLSQQSLME